MTLRSFYPTWPPELEWGPETVLRKFLPPPPSKICGGEFATAFLQYLEGNLYVLTIWDEPFSGEVRGDCMGGVSLLEGLRVTTLFIMIEDRNI